MVVYSLIGYILFHWQHTTKTVLYFHGDNYVILDIKIELLAKFYHWLPTVVLAICVLSCWLICVMGMNSTRHALSRWQYFHTLCNLYHWGHTLPCCHIVIRIYSA